MARMPCAPCCGSCAVASPRTSPCFTCGAPPSSRQPCWRSLGPPTAPCCGTPPRPPPPPCARSRCAPCPDSRGRRYAEPADPYRTAFQRDRDRIIHSSAYRRLGNKTQVFISCEGEHYRTRLTHTEEATQVAVSIARALGANVDLTEAIARA